MDRNSGLANILVIAAVALRKESVDRNINREMSLIRPYVALRKESVDRNLGDNPKIYIGDGSLSARRAWIEIIPRMPLIRFCPSLSARRAWIEISTQCKL